MAGDSTARVAVVSGGGTGIGRATAAALAGDGMDVVILERREEVLRGAAEELNRGRAAAGGQVSWVRADVSDPEQVAAAAGVIRERYPVVEVVVNNAGGSGRKAGADLGELAGVWLEAYRTNVISAVLLTSALLPVLRRPGGRVIIVRSRAAATGGASPAYVAAKAALGGVGAVAGRAARAGGDHRQRGGPGVHGRDRAADRADAGRPAQADRGGHRRGAGGPRRSRR